MPGDASVEKNNEMNKITQSPFTYQTRSLGGGGMLMASVPSTRVTSTTKLTGVDDTPVKMCVGPTHMHNSLFNNCFTGLKSVAC
jgi:hypothetical protein